MTYYDIYKFFSDFIFISNIVILTWGKRVKSLVKLLFMCWVNCCKLLVYYECVAKPWCRFEGYLLASKVWMMIFPWLLGGACEVVASLAFRRVYKWVGSLALMKGCEGVDTLAIEGAWKKSKLYFLRQRCVQVSLAVVEVLWKETCWFVICINCVIVKQLN